MQQMKAALKRQELVRVIGVGRIMHRNLIQCIGMRGGFDGVWLDLEHIGFSMESLEVATLAARSVGLECFCRVAPTDYATITQCLEAGAGGIMAAQIRTVEEAEQVVQWTKFYPRGARGLNVGGFDANYGGMGIPEFLKSANESNFVAIQVETAEAVECCDELAAIDGVDLLFVGPSDLSQALEVPGDFLHEKCLTALDKVQAACQKHGKSWGAVAANVEHAEVMISKGCQMLSPTSDVKLINMALAATKAEFGQWFD